MKIIKASAFIAFPLAAVITLTGCGGTTTLTNAPAQTGPPVHSVPSETPPAPSATKFGTPYIFTDDVEIVVSTPVEYTPGEFVDYPEGTTPVVFTFSLTNNSTSEITPDPYVEISSGDAFGENIFDAGNETYGDIGTRPYEPIAIGETVTWTEAFAVADPANIKMEVEIDASKHAPVQFETVK